jgi:(p)ppGpp synthase/HD superfamily hydrolase
MPEQHSYDLSLRERMFPEQHMFESLERIAAEEPLPETKKALYYMKQKHEGQYRKKLPFTEANVPYIIHPLMMACHARAMGFHDDHLLATILLHDVCEDCGVDPEELPFDGEVREAVRLLSFVHPKGKSEEEAKKEYYARIAENPIASVVKIIDRCNNLSTMAAAFTEEKMLAYIRETERYTLPLIRALNGKPSYRDAAFLLRYHTLSVMESVKAMFWRNRNDLQMDLSS